MYISLIYTPLYTRGESINHKTSTGLYHSVCALLPLIFINTHVPTPSSLEADLSRPPS